MDITQSYIQSELEGFYPNSAKLTNKIIGEMFGMLHKLGWTETDFDRTLQQYRNDPIRLETKTINFPPDVRQLIQLWNSHNSRVKKAAVCDGPRTKAPAWFKGAGEAMRKDGRTGLAVYMLSQAEQHPEYKLDRNH